MAIAVERLDNTQWRKRHIPNTHLQQIKSSFAFGPLSNAQPLFLTQAEGSSGLNTPVISGSCPSKVLKPGSPKYIENLQPICTISSEAWFRILITIAISNSTAIPSH